MYRRIAINVFLLDLKDSQPVLDPLKDIDQLVTLYDSTLVGLIINTPQRAIIAYYNTNIQTTKRHRRYCKPLSVRSGQSDSL